MNPNRIIVVRSLSELQEQVTRREFNQLDTLQVKVVSKQGDDILIATMYKKLRHTKVDPKTQKVRRSYRRTSEVTFLYTGVMRTVYIPGGHKPSGISFKQFMDYVRMRAKQTIENYG